MGKEREAFALGIHGADNRRFYHEWDLGMEIVARLWTALLAGLQVGKQGMRMMEPAYLQMTAGMFLEALPCILMRRALMKWDYLLMMDEMGRNGSSTAVVCASRGWKEDG